MSGAKQEERARDPVDDPEFKRVLHNLLTTPHKPQSELKVGKAKPKADKPVRKHKAAKEKG